jgi:phosphoribosyl-ATP pyrophosphohydrolase/phosphoribosyl-AMP cyclohydrolase
MRRPRSHPYACIRVLPASLPRTVQRTQATEDRVNRALRAAIVQDASSGRVLMLAWMNDGAERLTRETGEAWFWSRSRQRLWKKGETSGNTLVVEELRDDCDGDALLVRVRSNGPACHTGSASCFAPWLWRTVAERAKQRPSGSYVTSLLDEGVAACARKVGEEGVEVVVAALGESDERVIEEVADLWFHSYVLLAARGLDPAAVDAELARRRR